MIQTPAVQSSARDLSRLKPLLWLVLFLGLVSCSKETSGPTSGKNPTTSVVHKYYPTFAVAKISADFMRQQGVTFSKTNGWGFGLLEKQAKIASYVLAHPEDFSVTVLTGNFVPVVYNNQQTSIELVPDPRQQARDFDRYGMKISWFGAGVEVKDEDNQGYVNCNWTAHLGVDLKEPQGGSTGIGQGGGIGGYSVRVGELQMAPYFTVKDTTMWVIYGLNRK
jgi:hypothetical protein